MHPLAPDLSKLTDDELQKKRSELQNRMTFVYRTGNTDLVEQLSMLINDYDIEIQTRNQNSWIRWPKPAKILVIS